MLEREEIDLFVVNMETRSEGGRRWGMVYANCINWPISQLKCGTFVSKPTE